MEMVILDEKRGLFAEPGNDLYVGFCEGAVAETEDTGQAVINGYREIISKPRLRFPITVFAGRIGQIDEGLAAPEFLDDGTLCTDIGYLNLNSAFGQTVQTRISVQVFIKRINSDAVNIKQR